MNSAVIVAAGQGRRMGQGADKLFLEVAGRPLVAHTWQRFNDAACIDEIVLVVRDGRQAAFADCARQFDFRKPFRLVVGGAERQDSVGNGLAAVSPAAELVAIQDAARPCTSEALLAGTIEAARQSGAAVAAQAVTDTIKESHDGTWVARTVDRSRLWSVQTPQTFRVEVIRRALAEARRRGVRVTDDTAACELIGQPVCLVVNAAPNPKVTRPEDLPYVDWLLRGQGTVSHSGPVLVRHEADSARERSACGWRYRLLSREDQPLRPAAWAHAVDIDGAKLHYHKRSTELYYVLEGAGEVRLDGVAHPVRKGSLLHIPPGVVHGARGRMRVLVVGIPDIAEDDYFEAPAA